MESEKGAEVKKYHSIHQLKILPTWHVRRTTKLIIAIAALVCAFPLVTLMAVLNENTRLKERVQELQISAWEKDARVYAMQEMGCFQRFALMPVDTRRK